MTAKTGAAGPDQVLYTAEATSSGDGRNGHVRSGDGRLELDLAMVPAFGGSGEGSNPEQLFACGYAACFHSALQLVAGRAGSDIQGSSVTAHVGIGPQGEAFALAVRLVIDLHGVERDQAPSLVQAAHEICPYSRAVSGNVPVELEIA